MATATEDPARGLGRLGLRARLVQLVARPGFQKWASGFFLTRGLVRREGAELFDLVQGFVASQVLFALVELGLLHRLMDGPATADELASGVGVSPDRLERLLQAAAAMGLLRRKGPRFAITRKGAALIGVPGLEDMIRHHDVLYRDLADPVAFLRGETETELAGFWPYVFGAEGQADPDIAARYSRLMTESQGLVAQDTLRTVTLSGITHLLDIGGGSGAFARAALEAAPALRVTLFDLPDVVATAEARFAGTERIAVSGGSFRTDPLPSGCDGASLIRVLYDHEDATVEALLQKVWQALPEGGRLIISEPMSGGATPDRAGDIYFAFYCMAMRTGTVRSQARIADLLAAAGFSDIRTPRSLRPYVTSVVTAKKPRQESG